MARFVLLEAGILSLLAGLIGLGLGLAVGRATLPHLADMSASICPSIPGWPDRPIVLSLLVGLAAAAYPALMAARLDPLEALRSFRRPP